MRVILSFFLLTLVVLQGCKNKEEAVINGVVKNAKGTSKIYLLQQDAILDSAIVNEDGRFKFHVRSEQPNFFFINLGEKNYLLVVKNGEEISFEADLADVNSTYSLSGSENAKAIESFNSLNAEYSKLFAGLNKQYEEETRANPAKVKEIEARLSKEYNNKYKEFSDKAVAFGLKNRDNLAGFYAISTLDITKYAKEAEEYVAYVKDKFPGNIMVANFVMKVSAASKLTVGNKAPEFTLNDERGQPVSLSRFRGKYLLIDFWASWCGPCRQENPNVVRAYVQYKNRGFDILGVSLDDSKDKWIEAIKVDHLSWTHVSELKQWNGKVSREYNIEAIPANFLLDKEGVIIARNLRGEELQSYLAKLLK